eukprot:TRINITY_DN8919_c0_g1_i4.p1 TRINITY_DN8919_c0_g1~~TRINITY_DN8919_c0_g1_i4.p1  ORF type:complete len:486 (+),score=79.58 TRINITY_DN8919_c0_g1_i4:416-1873(+)
MGNDRSAYTVDEALTAMGFGKFQVLGLIYAGMGWLTEAMEMMLLSFIGPTVQSEWGLSSYEESLISSAVFAGMIVGAYLWGIFSDNYGRKKGFFVTAVVTGGAGFLSSFAPNYSILIILRCLVGIGLGGCPVLLSWLLEFVPAPCRGTSVAVLSAFWTLGTVFEALLAWIVIPRLSWRWFLALSSLPALMLLLFYSFMPESPRYLCMKGRKTDALHVLEKISRVNKMKLPPGMLVLDKKVEQYENSIQEETACLLPEERHEPTTSGGSNFRTGVSATPFMLFSPQLIKSTLLLWVVYFGNGFSYYGIVLLTSEISNSSRKCVSNGLEHSKGTSSLYRDVLITSFAEFPGLLISAAAVDRIGRKLSFSALYFVCFIFLLPLLVPQPEVLTTALLFGARICITGAFTVANVYTPEIYPTMVRSTGLGVANMMSRISGMICPLVAVGLVHDCHQTLSIVLFEFVIFLAGLAVSLFPVETKGLELQDSI